MKKKHLLLILIAVIYFLQFQNLFGDDKMNEENNPAWQWFAWKYENTSDPEQKKVIAYFKNIDKLVAKATATRYKTKECEWGYPDPKKAYEIVIQLIKVAAQISPPPVCKKHYDLSMQILKSVAGYQKIRADLGDKKIVAKRKEDQKFEEKIRNDQLEQSKLEAETSREFYIVLRKTGFYDNALNEMLDLKLITPAERAEFERLQAEDAESEDKR